LTQIMHIRTIIHKQNISTYACYVLARNNDYCMRYCFWTDDTHFSICTGMGLFTVDHNHYTF